MSWKRNIMMGIFLAILLMQYSVQAKEIKRSYATEEVCGNGECQMKIYSGIRFVPENGKWIEIEKAERLDDKEVFTISVESDKIHKLEVTKFNYSCITMRTGTEDIMKYEYGEEIDMKVDGKTVGTINKPGVLSEDIEIEYCFEDNVMSHEYSFGKESTKITIGEAETGTQEDTYLDSSYNGREFGSCDTFNLLGGYSSYKKHGIIETNITILEGKQIISAYLYLYMYPSTGNNLDVGESFYVQAHKVYENYTVTEGIYDWDEGDECSGIEPDDDEIVYGRMPDEGSEFDPEYAGRVLFDSASATSTWYNIEVTDIVKEDTEDERQNTTIFLYSVNEAGSPSTSDYIKLYTKEASNSDYRPYIEVLYTEQEDCVDNTQVNWGNWTNDTADDCEWYRGTSTPTSSTGPQGGGIGGADDSFFYIESSSGYCYSEGDEANLILEREITFRGEDRDEITFSHHKYGVSPGNLSLEENTTGTWTTLWWNDTNNGNEWFEEEVNLSGITGSGYIRFRNYATGGYWGDTAIDGIVLNYDCSIETSCDSEHCSLCETEEDCETATCYWNVDECIDEEPGTECWHVDGTGCWAETGCDIEFDAWMEECGA